MPNIASGPSLISQHLTRPDCPGCGTQMDLSRIEPAGPGHDLRWFECPKCAQTIQLNVKYRDAG